MAEQSRIRYEAKPALNLGPDHDIITTGKSIDEAKADLMIKTFNPAVYEPQYPNMRDNLGNTLATAQNEQDPEEEAPENED